MAEYNKLPRGHGTGTFAPGMPRFGGVHFPEATMEDRCCDPGSLFFAIANARMALYDAGGIYLERLPATNSPRAEMVAVDEHNPLLVERAAAYNELAKHHQVLSQVHP